ncbi:MAG: isoprenylcysteine carboxyl methyltransferase [Desulfuromonadales bacterium]|nr:isoprenylcysteine carboxyl methyltransferase [Desulfuromonadales bacterium]
MSLWWVFGFFFLERGFELGLARRNRRRQLARGGIEVAPQSYRSLVVLHLLFFVSLLIESYPWRIPLDLFTFFCLVMLVLTQSLRYWCIVTLGDQWNTRIIVQPQTPVKRSGPYRLLRHPNYLAVTLEIAVLPLLMRAPVTLFIFTLANLAVLRRRITLEEAALREHTDWGKPASPNPAVNRKLPE